MKLDQTTLSVLGTWLKDARKDAGLSQQQVAKSLNFVSNQYVSNVERGLAPPSDAFLANALATYNVDPEDFVGTLQDLYCEQIERNFL